MNKHYFFHEFHTLQNLHVYYNSVRSDFCICFFSFLLMNTPKKMIFICSCFNKRVKWPTIWTKIKPPPR